MKTLTFILGWCCAQIAFGQNNLPANQSGIYMNWENYLSGKLSYDKNCNCSVAKIRLNHFFSRNYIEVSIGKEKVRLKKDSIFGYRDCKNKSYRFFKSNDGEYLIAENKSIVIYTYEVSVVSSSEKTARLVPAYYFSTSLHSEIHPLTVMNLKKVFPDNLKLHDLLDLEFKGIKDISGYDSVHEMYTVNFLISRSITNN